VLELIFKPNIVGIESRGIQDGILQSANECHGDYTNLLLENIVVSGGNSKFPNFKERLKNEIYSMVDHDLVKDINIFEEKETEPVIEGKLFARNIDLLKDIAIYKQQYDELEYSIIWKICY
jgi:actin-related protein 6